MVDLSVRRLLSILRKIVLTPIRIVLTILFSPVILLLVIYLLSDAVHKRLKYNWSDIIRSRYPESMFGKLLLISGWILLIDAFLLNSELITVISQFAETNQSIIALVLSGLLVLLYFEQFNTQRLQTEVLEEQANISQATHRPVLHVSNLIVRKDSLDISIANVGNGLVKDMRVGIYAGFKSEFHIHFERSYLEPAKSSLLEYGSGKTHLLPDKQGTFSVQPSTYTKSAPFERPGKWLNTFSELTDESKLGDGVAIGVMIYISYRDMNNQQHTDVILAQESCSLEDGHLARTLDGDRFEINPHPDISNLLVNNEEIKLDDS